MCHTQYKIAASVKHDESKIDELKMTYFQKYGPGEVNTLQLVMCND